MRWVSFSRDGAVHAGVLDDSGVVEAGEGGVGELLRSGGLPDVAPDGEVVPLSSVRLLPPMQSNSLVNYADRALLKCFRRVVPGINLVTL